MRRNHGFTITELMVSVVIIGVLASLAIPSFTSYIYKARVSEATNFLGKIKQRQDAYRNEFGQYCAVNGDDWGTYNPTNIPGIDPVVWSPTAEWRQLAAAPDGPGVLGGVDVLTQPGDGELHPRNCSRKRRSLP